jgi:hypothetical protein
VPSEEVLARISRHLRSAQERIGGEGAERTWVSITRAQVRIEGLLGTLPLEGERSERTTLEHLEEAGALAEGHLGAAGLEGQIRRAIREAVAAAREEL